jgi:hypothetical protein
MNRFRLGLFALLCLGLAGCVEGETTYTVNPDGTTKVRMEIVTAVPPTFGGPPKKKDAAEDTPEGMLRQSVRSMLENPKLAAWKDVSAEILPNGKLKFSGTAYIRQLSDFAKQGGLPVLSPSLAVDRTPDGAFKLVRRENSNPERAPDPNKRKPKTPEEIKTMTDAQLDAEILRELIEIQSGKGLIVAVFNDCKLKATFVLPGEVTDAKGFVRDGNKASFTIDGNKIIADMNKVLSLDRPTLRKAFRDAKEPDVFKTLILGDAAGDGSVTVAKPGQPLFDFEKEVKEAHAAYPELRKKFGFGDDLRLPGEMPKK